MTPHYADDWLTVYHGDSRAVMAEMPPGSVHCVVTSPPYWGLRDYGTATWLGGDEGCDHSPEKRGGRFATPVSAKQRSNNGSGGMSERNCRCGAVRQDSQLGLEPTPEEYVANMVAVFREVRRVLRADGTVWLNLGDSYNNRSVTRPSSHQRGLGFESEHLATSWKENAANGKATLSINGGPFALKEKDLVGIPWRVAFALQADGWYLRSDIIWSKPNPMPESVTDRPTKSHEYLFLLSKSPRYYFDADAVREASGDPREQWQRPRYIGAKHNVPDGQRGDTDRVVEYEQGRNIRSVWTIATAPYPGAHFATFPPKLVEPCIKAGTSERGVCPECGKHWRRVTETTPMVIARSERTHSMGHTRSSGTMLEPATSRTLSWIPSCAHVAEPVPATVLDPFAGSGTTGMVAQSLSRRAVLIDLSMDYLDQLMKRNRDIPLGLGA